METSDRDLATEITYRWKRRFESLGVAKVLPELKLELRRFIMTPEAIAKFNREQSCG